MATDQRGGASTRVFDDPTATGSGVDIGAFELHAVLVDNAIDEDDAVTSAGDVSLREAIGLVQANPTLDTITFDGDAFSSPNSVIRLTLGELEITNSLSIDGTSVGGVVITGDANGDDETVGSSNITDVSASSTMQLMDNSRVVNFTGSSGNLTLTDSIITGGRTTGRYEEGGGIRFDSNDTLTLNNSTVSGNSTSGYRSGGGGIYTASGDVSIVSSTLSGNSTSGEYGYGGGIRTRGGDVSLVSSTLSGNSTSGYISDGGGIRTRSGDVSLVSSTLSGNSTSGEYGFGGGIRTTSGDVSLVSSTLSGNSTAGYSAEGGGIFTVTGDVSLVSSTVSGNSTSGENSDGGGISTRTGSVSLVSSTVTGNSASRAGGGVFGADSFSNASLTISNSIVAGNFQNRTSGNPGSANDLVPDPDSVLTINHSLIGVADGLAITGGNNFTGTAASPLDPLLGPLADNGGPTQTHALLSGSPAIDAGNNDLAVDADGSPLLTDQRGVGFERIQDGGSGTATVDIGAVEGAFVLGDANQDGEVNFDDISTFISLLADSNFLNEADTNRDGTVDFDDISSFITLLAGGRSAQSNSEFKTPLISSASTLNPEEKVVDAPVNESVSLVSVSTPETDSSSVATVEASATPEASSDATVSSESVTVTQDKAVTKPLPPATLAPLALVSGSLPSPVVDSSPRSIVDTKAAGRNPIDTFIGSVAVASDRYRFLDNRISSSRASEGDGPLAKRAALTGFAERVEFSNDSRGQQLSGKVSPARSFTKAAELFDAHPESLDEVFDLEFDDALAGLV